jgi:hypothetical protein
MILYQITHKRHSGMISYILSCNTRKNNTHVIFKTNSIPVYINQVSINDFYEKVLNQTFQEFWYTQGQWHCILGRVKQQD